MGSIPLPELDVRVPQAPSMIAAAQGAQSLQNARTENQLGQGQVQIQQQQIKDQRAMTQAMQEWDGQDFNQLPSLMLKHGASATAVIGLKNEVLKQQRAYADLSKEQLENESAKHDQVAGALSPLLDPNQVADADFPMQVRSTAQDLLKRGLIDPQHEQTAEQLAGLPPDQARAQLGLFVKGSQAQSVQAANALKQSEQSKNTAQGGEATAKAAEAQANTAKTQVETDMLKKYGGMSDAQQQARYLNIQMQQRRGLPVSPDDAAFAKSYEHLKTLVPVANFNMQNAGLSGSPQQPSAIAQGLANNTMKWQDVVSARTPASVKEALLKEVKQINPNFNSGDFQVEQKVREKYTSGNVADQLGAINVAREHMKTFSQLADALDNGNVQALNKLGNAIGVQFGSDKASNFRIAAQAFGGEVGKAFDGAGVVAGEREKAEKNFNDAMSKGQFKGAIQTVDQLLAGKQRAAKQTYDLGRTGQPNFGNGSGAVRPGAPSGATHTAMGSDGKRHYTNAQGQDLGVAP